MNEKEKQQARWKEFDRRMDNLEAAIKTHKQAIEDTQEWINKQMEINKLIANRLK